MSDRQPPLPGQVAAGLLQLRSYRDILTEQFLGGDTMQQLLGFGRRPVVRGFGGDARGGLLQEHGIVGVGIGGETSSARLIVFAESRSDAVNSLEGRLQDAAVPATVFTDVRFVAAGARPVPAGGSIGFGKAGGPSGTLGCVVKPRQGSGQYGLTCNHVIADLNRATIRVDDVWAPGAAVGGCAADRLGLVHDFAPIDFTAGHSNIIDAALTEPSHPGDLDPAITGIGNIAGLNIGPAFGEKVQKSGVVTGHTFGYYWYQINANISYSGGSTALFRDLLGIVGAPGNFAHQGDSGALVLDDLRRATGMLISVASGLNLSLATAIKPVLDHFDVDIV